MTCRERLCVRVAWLLTRLRLYRPAAYVYGLLWKRSALRVFGVESARSAKVTIEPKE